MATILVVDDDHSIRTLLRDLLEQAGHQVVEAADGALALLRIGESRPDLLVTDVAMPIMDGTALVRHLRDDPVLACLPIIVVSGEERPLARVDATFRKPFEPRALLAAAASLLSAAPVG